MEMETVRYLIIHLIYLYKKKEQISQVDMANSGSGKCVNTITFIFNDLGIES